jgi:dynein heavy chain
MKRPNDLRLKLNELFTKVFDEILNFVLTKLSPKIRVYECNYIKQVLDILDGLIMHDVVISDSLIEKYFVFSLMWSLGALLELDDKLIYKKLITIVF